MLNGNDAKAAVADIVRDEMLLCECRRAAHRVHQLAGKVGSDGVYIAMQPLIILFRPPDFDDPTGTIASTWIALYQSALKHLPKEALEHAVSQWIAFGKPFFPKPSELNALAKAKAEEIWKIDWRVRQAIEYADKVKPVEKTPQDIAAVKAMLEEWRGRRSLRHMPGASYQSRSPHEVAESLREMAR